MAYKGNMPYMQGESKSYKPPKGSAGSAAFGEYSHKKNPKSVPKKGSSIRMDSAYQMNPDKAKVKRLEAEQAKAESLRGKGC